MILTDSEIKKEYNISFPNDGGKSTIYFDFMKNDFITL